MSHPAGGVILDILGLMSTLSGPGHVQGTSQPLPILILTTKEQGGVPAPHFISEQSGPSEKKGRLTADPPEECGDWGVHTGPRANAPLASRQAATTLPPSFMPEPQFPHLHGRVRALLAGTC